ncbi:uncharacterized protein SAPINGB_P005333 [Magnusiomyces paraingens]|uniref:F-box domain-containing protein n=1 Tax=Magnusiomyces paraingens TaxID=2606893 RepID=A0A5E8C6P9_9ASCO|nr:uncharacterized protein SAPINGB_P005333 [Saprochaete ingens]VVT56846.1 unnamed protein product [Saprochaete ingens]
MTSDQMTDLPAFSLLSAETHTAIAQFLSVNDLKALSQTSRALREVYAPLAWSRCIAFGSGPGPLETQREARAYEARARVHNNYTWRAVPWAAVVAPQKYASWFRSEFIRHLRLERDLETELGAGWTQVLEGVIGQYPELRTVDVRHAAPVLKKRKNSTETSAVGKLEHDIYSFSKVVDDTGDSSSVVANLLRLQQLGNVVEIFELILSGQGPSDARQAAAASVGFVLENLTLLVLGAMPVEWFKYVVDQTSNWPNLRIFSAHEIYIGCENGWDAKLETLNALPSAQLSSYELVLEQDNKYEHDIEESGGRSLALEATRVTLKQATRPESLFDSCSFKSLDLLTIIGADEYYAETEIQPFLLHEFVPTITRLSIDLSLVKCQRKSIESLAKLPLLKRLHVLAVVRLQDESRDQYYTVASCVQELLTMAKPLKDRAARAQGVRDALEKAPTGFVSKLLNYNAGTDVVQTVTDLVAKPATVFDSEDIDTQLLFGPAATLEVIFGEVVPQLRKTLEYLSVTLVDEHLMAIALPGLGALLQEAGLQKPEDYALRQVKVFSRLEQQIVSTVGSLYDVVPWYPYRFFSNYDGNGHTTTSVLYDVKQKRNLDELTDETAPAGSGSVAETEIFEDGFAGWLR